MGYNREAVHAAHRSRMERLQSQLGDKMEQAKLKRDLYKQQFEKESGSPEIVRIVSSMKDVKSAVENTNEAINMLGSIMQIVAEEVQKISNKEDDITKKDDPSSEEWDKFVVTVSERDYKGNIKKLEVSKV